MSTVVRSLASAFVAVTLLVLSHSPAYAQGGTTSTLSGIAVDSSGAVLPGADVTVTMAATGFTQSAVTNADGAFSFPGLNIGTYSVTVKLSGFKTFVSNNVVLTSGAGASVRAILEIGGVEEQVVVSSASEIIQTQSTTISSTINTTQILKLPLTTRLTTMPTRSRTRTSTHVAFHGEAPLIRRLKHSDLISWQCIGFHETDY